ncbi:fungal-specific transcription factor domain-containing protein [Mycena epipterygia]|nr:fungal-specific transcription factor domain-containing protein [Mycena epipterygia]
MLSNSEDSYEGEATSKKKRVQRACEMCRRKKRRCDGGEICDHCAKHKFICTYVDPPAQTRSPITPDLSDVSPKVRSYIEALEARVKTLEALLEKPKTEKNPGLQLIRNAIQRLNSPLIAPHSDDSTFAEIDESFRALAINHFSDDQGFHGKSSGAMLVKAVVDLRDGAKNTATVSKASEPVKTRQATRPTPDSPVPPYSFPEGDFLMSLISFYFENINPFLPLLHRHTFESGVRRKLHLTHAGFAKTVLLVCALGALYSNDAQRPPRAPGLPPRPPGFRYIEQVDLFGHMRQYHPTIYDLQAYCLAATFVNCACLRGAWTLVGLGIRLAQDIGAHRFKLRSITNNLEQELEKRASWVLWLFDIQMSTALGRSNALQAYDFDVEMPIICDDDYWNAPIPIFSPPNKPSVVAFFNSMLQLNHILSFSCSTLYSNKRRKMLVGLGDGEWEEQVVAELDVVLNTWFETIPEHLRWDPDHPIQNDIFFDQSAVLHCTYYHTRIIIHRPLIHTMRSSQHLQSLTICTTAARACSQVAQIQHQRRPKNPLWFSQAPLFTSAVVLLLNIWGGFASTRAADKDLVDIRHCMGVLAAQQHQWPAANHLLDTLRPLVGGEHSSEGVDATSAPETPFPNLRTEQQFGDPFPAELSPPLYDPHLETAPQYFGDGSWYDAFMGPSDAQLFSGEDQNYMYGPDLGFVPPGNPQESNSHVLDFNGEELDVNMMDARTIALWSRAPPSFG